MFGIKFYMVVLDLDPVMILMVFFCSWNTFLLSDEFPQNIQTPLQNRSKYSVVTLNEYMNLIT
jgi:hypothetical protein